MPLLVYSGVIFGYTQPDWFIASLGFPKVSVLGPIFYVLYTSDLSQFLSSLGVCCLSVCRWYTEYTDTCWWPNCKGSLLAGRKCLRHQKYSAPGCHPTTSGWTPGKSSSSGVVAMGRCVKSICLLCQMCFYHLCQICTLHHSPTTQVATNLMHAYAKEHYSNAVYAGDTCAALTNCGLH